MRAGGVALPPISTSPARPHHVSRMRRRTGLSHLTQHADMPSGVSHVPRVLGSQTTHSAIFMDTQSMNLSFA